MKMSEHCKWANDSYAINVIWNQIPLTHMWYDLLKHSVIEYQYQYETKYDMKLNVIWILMQYETGLI